MKNMRRWRVSLVASASLCAGLGLGLGQASARQPSVEERRETLREAARRELELTQAASALARGQQALERERESLDWAAGLLERQAHESLRKLDNYREHRVERESTSAVRARKLYELARGGGMLELMFEDGSSGHMNPRERALRGRTVRKLIDRDLELLHVHADAEAKARDELLAATRELRIVAALESIGRLEKDALALTSAALDPVLRTAHAERRELQTEQQGLRRSQSDRELLHTVISEHRELRRARGLDMLEKDALVRPVNGRVVGRFGTYDDPLLGVPMHRNGVELRARPNDEVVAIAPGQVVLVGALPGFERVVVIDHGGGYLSLSARLLAVSVAEGDELEAGAVLGRVGAKAVADGLGTTAYLEIRHGQRPIDPNPYL